MYILKSLLILLTVFSSLSASPLTYTIDKCTATVSYDPSFLRSSSLSTSASSLSSSSTSSVFGLRNVKELIQFNCSQRLCTVSLPLPSPFAGTNSTLIHIYRLTVPLYDSSSSFSTTSSIQTVIERLATFILPSASSECVITPYQPPTSSSKLRKNGPVISLLYEAWQAYASNATRYVQSVGGTPLSVEQVIRSNGNLSLYNIWDQYDAGQYTQGFFYQETPALGYYCIYRKRWNESIGVLPDCINITGIVTQQTAWFNQGNIDFVTADGTNLCTPSPFADAIQTRPFEVLIEEFSALRNLGVPTPSVAAWQRSATGCTLWQNILDVYNNATYGALIYKDPATGKKVFFVPDSPDPSIVQQIEANGGRNDILVQEMWALFDQNTYQNGRWAFMTPCTDSSNSFTTNVVGLQRGATGCGQFITQNSTLGSAIAVSPSYQLSYGSVPFSAANKYEGLTYKRQFGTVFDNMMEQYTLIKQKLETNALDRTMTNDIASLFSTAVPDNIYLSSWNEWLSQPQANPFNSPDYAFSMGIPWDTKYRDSLYVDTYGSSIGRDVEPSVTHGTQLLDIMTSCLRVIQIGSVVLPSLLVPDLYSPDTSSPSLLSLSTQLDERFFSLPPTARLSSLIGLFGHHNYSRLSSCSVQNEICCTYNETTDGYAVVFSLKRNDGGDQLLTIDPDEVAKLTCPNCGWTQICNGYGGPTDFCVDQNVLQSSEAMQGPFTLPSGGCGINPSDSTVLENRIPLVRCYDGTHHFFSTDPSCGGGSNKMEFAIGCLMASRDSNTPRALRSCSNPTNGKMYHMMDSDCITGDTDNGVLGYVH